MAIKVINLQSSYGSNYKLPNTRAALLAHSAVDYLDAISLVTKNSARGPLTSFLLPSMHQALELLTKAIAYTVDVAFDPKKYSHKTERLVRDYASRAPVFASMTARPRVCELLSSLEKAYLGVRYGECAWQCDGEEWQLFSRIAEELLDDLHVRTELKFLPKHYA